MELINSSVLSEQIEDGVIGTVLIRSAKGSRWEGGGSDGSDNYLFHQDTESLVTIICDANEGS